MTPHQRGALVRVLRDEVVGCVDREQLLAHARRWLFEHRLLIVHDRALRALVATASRELEAETAATIRRTVSPAMWQRWLATTTETRPDGQTTQSWLWSAPAKHSTRQIFGGSVPKECIPRWTGQDGISNCSRTWPA